MMYLFYRISLLFNFESAFEIQVKTVKAVNDVHLRATNKQQASEQNWKLNFHISVGVRYRVRHVLFNGTEWVLLCGWIFEFKIGVLSVELILISTAVEIIDAARLEILRAWYLRARHASISTTEYSWRQIFIFWISLLQVSHNDKLAFELIAVILCSFLIKWNCAYYEHFTIPKRVKAKLQSYIICS